MSYKSTLSIQQNNKVTRFTSKHRINKHAMHAQKPLRGVRTHPPRTSILSHSHPCVPNCPLEFEHSAHGPRKLPEQPTQQLASKSAIGPVLVLPVVDLENEMTTDRAGTD